VRLIQVGGNTYLLRSGSNIGFVVQDGKAVVIDTGLDRDAARRAFRAVEELDASIEGIVITHAHADHFGGASFLRRRSGAPVYASPFEASVVENPLLEPFWLFGGAEPIKDLKSKFTLASPCEVDVVIREDALLIGDVELRVVSLPGHSPAQIGLASQDTLFCADAFFPLDILEKHPIPYCTNIDEALATLDAFIEGQMPYAHFVPGHGDALTDPREVALANRKRLEEIRGRVCELLTEPRETSFLIKALADGFGLDITNAALYYLCRTTVYAALSSLENQGVARAFLEGNRLFWSREVEG